MGKLAKSYLWMQRIVIITTLISWWRIAVERWEFGAVMQVLSGGFLFWVLMLVWTGLNVETARNLAASERRKQARS